MSEKAEQAKQEQQEQENAYRIEREKIMQKLSEQTAERNLFGTTSDDRAAARSSGKEET